MNPSTLTGTGATVQRQTSADPPGATGRGLSDPGNCSPASSPSQLPAYELRPNGRIAITCANIVHSALSATVPSPWADSRRISAQAANPAPTATTAPHIRLIETPETKASLTACTVPAASGA